MKRMHVAITVTTAGLLFFAVLCALPLPLLFLQLYLMGLSGSLVWMVVAILKNGEASTKTFDDHYYEDAGHHGPH